MVLIHQYTVDRTYLLALWYVEVANTLRAQIRLYLIDFFAHINGIIWAFGFANIAIDAVGSDFEGHCVASDGLNSLILVVSVKFSHERCPIILL